MPSITTTYDYSDLKFNGITPTKVYQRPAGTSIYTQSLRLKVGDSDYIHKNITTLWISPTLALDLRVSWQGKYSESTTCGNVDYSWSTYKISFVSVRFRQIKNSSIGDEISQIKLFKAIDSFKIKFILSDFTEFIAYDVPLDSDNFVDYELNVWHVIYGTSYEYVHEYSDATGQDVTPDVSNCVFSIYKTINMFIFLNANSDTAATVVTNVFKQNNAFYFKTSHPPTTYIDSDYSLRSDISASGQKNTQEY